MTQYSGVTNHINVYSVMSLDECSFFFFNTWKCHVIFATNNAAVKSVQKYKLVTTLNPVRQRDAYNRYNILHFILCICVTKLENTNLWSTIFMF